MNTTERTALLEQLRTATKPKDRLKACRRLAKTRDPEVIPALVQAYQHDQDEKVRTAARDALARFKGMQRKPGANRLSGVVFGVLALALIVSLGLHGRAWLQDNNDSADPVDVVVPTRQLQVTDRNTLIVELGSKMSEAQALATNLRVETQKYNNTGHVDCPISYTVPAPIELAEDDQYVFPDIRLFANTYDTLPPKFEIAVKLLDNACLNPDDQTNSVIKTAQRLDDIDAQLAQLNTLLQNAINNPAPTVWPTAPPVTPTPTNTLPPATATPVPDSTSAAPAPADGTPVGAVPAANPSATAAPEASPTPQPTITPTPEPTLPRPDLDYAAILAALDARFTQDFLLDLQNPYGTGMLDQWRQALTDRGQTTTNYCQFSTWPDTYTLPPDQQALLNAPGTADPQLEEALASYQEGTALATQALELYIRDCASVQLARSAEQGIALLSEAVKKLDRAQTLLNEIAARP